ncbi:MAG: hypothetical protein Q4D06_10185, partial [Coriobacteriia bacterium]|nr:hypothetical protein [Coriobacteriia bacterium]
EAGLKIAAACENVTPQFTDRAIARMFMRMRDEVRPQICSCSSKRLVEGTAGYLEPDFPDDKLRVYKWALTLLLSHTSAFFGGQMYAEVGENPRDWSTRTEVDGLIKQRGTSLEFFFDDLASQGYRMQKGPSLYW